MLNILDYWGNNIIQIGQQNEIFPVRFFKEKKKIECPIYFRSAFPSKKLNSYLILKQTSEVCLLNIKYQ